MLRLATPFGTLFFRNISYWVVIGCQLESRLDNVKASVAQAIQFILTITAVRFTITNKLVVNTFIRLTLKLFRWTRILNWRISSVSFRKSFIADQFKFIDWFIISILQPFIASWNVTIIIIFQVHKADRFLFQTSSVPTKIVIPL